MNQPRPRPFDDQDSERSEDSLDVEPQDDPRERGDDDGVEYADPRDEMEDRLLGDLW